MSALLQTTDLSIGHGGRVLQEGISIRLEAGSLTALLGVNGIGKSTLIRTLAGLRPAIAGEIHLSGQPLRHLSARMRARLVAVVLTGRPEMGALDVRTLVALGRQPWTNGLGRMTPGDRRSVAEAMERSGAQAFAHRSIGDLSDGEFQRVLIARALAQDTPILLLDEPTAFLDLTNRVAAIRLLHSIAHDLGRAVLFSTHDLQLALELGDGLILMREEGSVWQGTPRTVVAEGVLSAAFDGPGVRFDPAIGGFRVER